MTRLPTLVRRLHPARPMTRPMWMLLALLALAGCKQKVRILNPNVPRNPIVFESPEGADAFDTALDERYDRGDADIKPVKGRLSKNAFFNQQIEKVDENGDGIISDLEASRYLKRTEDDDDEEDDEALKNGNGQNGHH
ncbi:MAG TPA: hypothetical protein VFB62_16530 [Polyangiaceae bacterium]|jgi:hypothetical protein|nr:hypothetical protein [Polyangiaceae bacterium]